MIRIAMRLLLRGASLGAIAIIAVWYVWFLSPERPIRTITLTGRPNLDGEISPDGNYMFASLGDAAQHLIRLPGGEDIIPPALVESSVQFLDNDRALTIGWGVVRLVDLKSGKVNWELQGSSAWCWNADGSRIVCQKQTDQSGLTIVDTNRGEPIFTLPNACYPNWDMRGDQIISLVDSDSAAIVVWDARDGHEIKRFRSRWGNISELKTSRDGRFVVAAQYRENT